MDNRLGISREREKKNEPGASIVSHSPVPSTSPRANQLSVPRPLRHALGGQLLSAANFAIRRTRVLLQFVNVNVPMFIFCRRTASNPCKDFLDLIGIIVYPDKGLLKISVC